VPCGGLRLGRRQPRQEQIEVCFADGVRVLFDFRDEMKGAIEFAGIATFEINQGLWRWPLDALLRKLADRWRLVAFDLRFEIFGRDIGDAHSLNLLMLRHASFAGEIALRTSISAVARTFAAITTATVGQFKQFASASDGSFSDASRHLHQIFVVRLLCKKGT
jgi:hypothetical protein